MKKTNLKPASYISFIVIAFGLFLLPGRTSATHIIYDTTKSPNQNCNLKIDKTGCINAIKAKCGGNTSCAAAGPLVTPDNTFGGNIYRVCQAPNIPNAQTCQTAVQDKCGSAPAAQRATCQADEVARLITAATGAPATTPPSGNSDQIKLTNDPNKPFQCGANDSNPTHTRFDLGCLGVAAPAGTGPIADLTFGLIRFLAIGVGIIIAISIIFAGIMYTTSGGSPEQSSKAKDRILSALVSLLFYLLISALANFLIPGGLFR